MSRDTATSVNPLGHTRPTTRLSQLLAPHGGSGCTLLVRICQRWLTLSEVNELARTNQLILAALQTDYLVTTKRVSLAHAIRGYSRRSTNDAADLNGATSSSSTPPAISVRQSPFRRFTDINVCHSDQPYLNELVEMKDIRSLRFRFPVNQRLKLPPNLDEIICTTEVARQLFGKVLEPNDADQPFDACCRFRIDPLMVQEHNQLVLPPKKKKKKKTPPSATTSSTTKKSTKHQGMQAPAPIWFESPPPVSLRPNDRLALVPHWIKVPNDLILYLSARFLDDYDVYSLTQVSHFFFRILAPRYELKRQVVWTVCRLKWLEATLLCQLTPALKSIYVLSRVKPSKEDELVVLKQDPSDLMVFRSHPMPLSQTVPFNPSSLNMLVYSSVYSHNPHQIGLIRRMKLVQYQETYNPHDYVAPTANGTIPRLTWLPRTVTDLEFAEPLLMHANQSLKDFDWPSQLHTLTIHGFLPSIFFHSKMASHWPSSLTSLQLKPPSDQYNPMTKQPNLASSIHFPRTLLKLFLDSSLFTYSASNSLTFPPDLTDLTYRGTQQSLDKLVFQSSLHRLELGSFYRLSSSSSTSPILLPTQLKELILPNNDTNLQVTRDHSSSAVQLNHGLRILDLGFCGELVGGLPTTLRKLEVGEAPTMKLKVSDFVSLNHLRILKFHLVTVKEDIFGSNSSLFQDHLPTLEILKITPGSLKSCSSLACSATLETFISIGSIPNQVLQLFHSCYRLRRLLCTQFCKRGWTVPFHFEATSTLDLKSYVRQLPPSLVELQFDSSFTSTRLNLDALPLLRKLVLSGDFYWGSENPQRLPLHLTELIYRGMKPLPFMVQWPATLERLIFDCTFGSYSLAQHQQKLPDSLRELYFTQFENSCLKGLKLPPHLHSFGLTPHVKPTIFIHDLEALMQIQLPTSLQLIRLPHPHNPCFRRVSTSAYSAWIAQLRLRQPTPPRIELIHVSDD